MMKTLHYLSVLALIFCSLNLFSQSAKSLRRKGDVLEASGSFEKAADYFYRSLQKKSDNTKALLGLERTAPKVLNKTLKDVRNAYMDADYQAVINNYNIAASYHSKMKQYIYLDIPRPYLDAFSDSKEILAGQYYKSGKRNYDNGSYQSAISDFEKCLTYKSNYKDAGSLIIKAKDAKNITDAEKYYKSGISNLKSGNYRSAYHDFGTCLSYKSLYKDAQKLQSEALEKGKVRIGIFDFNNNTRVFGANGTLYSYVINNLANNRSPFIDIIDRQNLDRLLSEIRFSQSNSADASSAARAGKLLGLNFVVIGNVTNVFVEGGQILPQALDAFELYHVTVDGKQQPRGRQVRYTFYQGTSKVTFEAQYQIIEVETGRIVKSNVVSSNDSDKVSYARYQGDPSRLYLTDPGLAAGGEGVLGLLAAGLVSLTKVNQELFNARTNLKSPDELQANILKNIGDSIAREIISEFD